MLEGILTCILAVCSFPLVSDFPHEVEWLSEEEKQFISDRLFEDVGNSKAQEPLTPSIVFTVLKDCEYT